MSLIERLHRATAEMVADQEDPWRRVLERALPASVITTEMTAAKIGRLIKNFAMPAIAPVSRFSALEPKASPRRLV